MMDDYLQRLVLKGYKSIRDMDLELRQLNVLIGANGAGKSNLISFFKMLNSMMSRTNGLQQFIAESGRAQSLLHYGPKTTPQMEATLEFHRLTGVNIYHQRLFHVAGDTLSFADETMHFQRANWTGPHKQPYSLGMGHTETRILEYAEQGNTTAKFFRHLLNNCRVYHFHDTSPTARVRQYSYIEDNRTLLHDAGNLAPMLLHYQREQPNVYRRIVSTIRLIAPFFGDFVLEPSGLNQKDVLLNWREQGSDLLFGPHQLSDGTLRAMCLITLLLQHEETLPSLIIIDEPELGLHPYALNVIAALFKKVSHHTQVLISTQSSTFLDHFDPEDIIVVNREGKESRFARPDAEALEAWLEDYSLGEIWQKNVIGGGPH